MAEDWFAAAEEGNREAILSHLARGAEINARNKFGATALMLAVENCSITAIEALLSRGADLQVRDNMGWTAMTRAVLRARGLTVLHARCWTTYHGDKRPMDFLVGAGAQFGLREAVLLGDVTLARRLCDSDPSIDVSGDARFCFHDTYLMLAAQLGSLEMVDFLVGRGADIEGTDDLGHTTLMRAAEAGHHHVVAWLLDRGADVNGGWPDETALSEAEAHSHQSVAALLRSRGARRRLSDAINLGDSRLAEELLRGGADPNDDSFVEGCSTRLVMQAVTRGDAEIVRVLLDHGASHHIAHLDEHSLLAEAARQGHEDVVRLLIEHGSDVHAAGKDRLTPLEWASKTGHSSAVKLLRRAGASR